jgi:hypothetical protein
MMHKVPLPFGVQVDFQLAHHLYAALYGALAERMYESVYSKELTDLLFTPKIPLRLTDKGYP